jgi:hypothetical protein
LSALSRKVAGTPRVNHGAGLGAVYTCHSAYESPFDWVYDFRYKVVCNLTLQVFFLSCVDKQTLLVSEV